MYVCGFIVIELSFNWTYRIIANVNFDYVYKLFKCANILRKISTEFSLILAYFSVLKDVCNYKLIIINFNLQ